MNSTPPLISHTVYIHASLDWRKEIQYSVFSDDMSHYGDWVLVGTQEITFPPTLHKDVVLGTIEALRREIVEAKQKAYEEVTRLEDKIASLLALENKSALAPGETAHGEILDAYDRTDADAHLGDYSL